MLVKRFGLGKKYGDLKITLIEYRKTDARSSECLLLRLTKMPEGFFSWQNGDSIRFSGLLRGRATGRSGEET